MDVNGAQGLSRIPYTLGGLKMASWILVVLLLAGVIGLLRKTKEARCGGAVDVKRAADLYGQGRTLRQIGAELGVPWTAVGHQIRRAGVAMRRGGDTMVNRFLSYLTRR
jgi:hypothetical protein